MRTPIIGALGALSWLCVTCAGAAPVVVAVGDSTTALRKTVKTVYAAALQEDLTARRVEAQVINAGVGGNTTADVLRRLEKDVLARKPAVVIVQLGINDASAEVWREPPETKPRIDRKQFETNLRSMVRAGRDCGASVILMTPNPTRWTPQLRKLYGKPPYRVDDADGFNVLLVDYVASVRKVAASEKVPVIDIYAAFEEHGKKAGQSVEDLLLDGMHPNDRGHRLVADLLLPRVMDALKARADR